MQRRDVLKTLAIGTSGAFAAACGSAPLPRPAPPNKTPFVLVHGAFHGAWVWGRVAERLRMAGHPVFAPTLTGMGQRSHLISPNVNLDTHIADVVGVIDNEELTNVVLVGHSYAGIVVTGVADRRNDRLRQVIYFDAVLPENGKAWADFNTPDVVARRKAEVAAKGEGYRWSVEQSPAAYGVTDRNDAAWLQRRFSAFPFAAYLQPLRIAGPGLGKLPRAYIDCTQPVFAPINRFREQARADRGFKVMPLAAGHDGMVNKPDEVTKLFRSLAGTA
jgi:pimeloyl-ACP methyl ester carboxylesterase